MSKKPIIAVKVRAIRREIAEGYRAMAADQEREKEAAEGVENLTGDVADELSL